jgi:membrane dipeptidase
VADQTPRAPEPADIREIVETGGVVGLMMAIDLHAKGYARRGIEIALASMDYLIQHGGEDVVAIGSDFDGFTKVPKDLRSPRDYAGLRQAMLRKYTPAQVAKFLNGNAERALKMGWGN